jgi:zinc resistance-associated protein
LSAEEDQMLKPVTFKSIIAATALLAIAGSTYVYAQQGFGGHRGFGGDGPRFEHRHRMSPADMAAFTDARIAALKAGLELTPDQTKNWPAFEQAVRDMAQLRMQRMQDRLTGDQQPPAAPFERLARRADTMAKTSAALKKVADAGAPLYQSLNDDQKGRFTMLARMLRPHHHMHAFMQRGGGERFGEGDEGPGWRHHGDHDGQRFGQEQGDGGDQGSRL